MITKSKDSEWLSDSFAEAIKHIHLSDKNGFKIGKKTIRMATSKLPQNGFARFSGYSIHIKPAKQCWGHPLCLFRSKTHPCARLDKSGFILLWLVSKIPSYDSINEMLSDRDYSSLYDLKDILGFAARIDGISIRHELDALIRCQNSAKNRDINFDKSALFSAWHRDEGLPIGLSDLGREVLFDAGALLLKSGVLPASFANTP